MRHSVAGIGSFSVRITTIPLYHYHVTTSDYCRTTSVNVVNPTTAAGWASRLDDVQVGPPVGVMGLEQDVQVWYGQQPLTLGMAYRQCDRLEPSVQVGSLLRLTLSDQLV